jgi:hypothetical protein
VFIAAAIVSFWRGSGQARAGARAPAAQVTVSPGAVRSPQQPTKPQRKARAS